MNTNSGTEISTSLVMVPYVRCTMRSKIEFSNHGAPGL